MRLQQPYNLRHSSVRSAPKLLCSRSWLLGRVSSGASRLSLFTLRSSSSEDGGGSDEPSGAATTATPIPDPIPEPEPEPKPESISAASVTKSVSEAEKTVGLEASPSPTIPPASSNLQSFPIEPTSEDLFAFQELAEELKDPNEFGKRGEAYFFAQAAVVALIVFPPWGLKGLVPFLGTIAVTTGAVFILYSLLSLNKNLSPFPEPRKQAKLVTTGMYGYCRHPMYGGLLLCSFGFAAVTGSETRLVLSVLLWIILEQKIQVEEGALTKRFPDYTKYIQSVKKFVPFVY